ncbi:hypothetical protein HK099_005550 [Clydaea vesicula]|uniref:Nicotinamide-nucleotide adenylyltransferase n=1 Tax=Clydaea vesicula TaxID=447962 RepID=A0AAD5U2B5_9FUNG|nr:hypothetical protein HK099_005550 [Clydaea vesicula]KAJ3393497.1 hypothetical protein HDU92_007693 [Lobulomyces angularis]
MDSFPRQKLKATLTDTSKIPLVLVACGSFSPITYLHLRMFEMALDWVNDHGAYEILGGYFSPVSDGYDKKGLAPWKHRVKMCELSVMESKWLMVDSWEASRPTWSKTLSVLEHFDEHLNGKNNEYCCVLPDGTKKRIKIMLLAGGDLIQSFAVPKLWAESDLDTILGVKFGCVVIERTGADIHDFLLKSDALYRNRKSVFVVKQFIHNDISSTKIRLFVRRNMSIKYLLPDAVIDYIYKVDLYSLPQDKDDDDDAHII